MQGAGHQLISSELCYRSEVLASIRAKMDAYSPANSRLAFLKKASSQSQRTPYFGLRFMSVISTMRYPASSIHRTTLVSVFELCAANGYLDEEDVGSTQQVGGAL